ncbi:MAG: penicillin-binding protein activator [candidate division KSB1 bacterium]|nr:penicillin-binding protein activator [candidate division KSB1 bacterium]
MNAERTICKWWWTAGVSALIVLSGRGSYAAKPQGDAPWQQIRYSEEAEKAFSEGLILYRNGEYEQARLRFAAILGTTPPTQRVTSAYLMQAKTLQKLGAYREANHYAQELIERYPWSAFVDDAHVTMAWNWFALGNAFEAAREYMTVVDGSREEALRGHAARQLEALATAHLSIDEVRRLEQDYARERSRALLTVVLAERELESGQRAQAIRRLTRFVELYPKSQQSNRVRALLDAARSEAPGRLKVGVILPLSGHYGEQGRAVLRGMQYGLRSADQAGGPALELVVQDSESDIVKAVLAAQRLALDPSILCVVGELEASASVAVGTALATRRVPLLIPVSTENGLTLVGQGIFQLNADLDRQGALLARYAVQQLGLRTFATLAPRDRYGLMITDSFVQTVDALGGVIVAQKWYYEGATDLGRQLASIREQGLKFALQRELSRSGRAPSQAELDAAWQRELSSSRTRSTEGKSMLESHELSATGIDAVFFPIYNDQIQIVVPQFALHNIKAQVLGGGYWDDLEQLRANHDHVEGAIFVSGHHIDERSPEYTAFRDAFRVAMGTTPTEMDVFGYDTFRLIRKVVADGGVTREEFVRVLQGVKDFQGLKGRISFADGTRVCNEAVLLRFSNGLIVPVE